MIKNLTLIIILLTPNVHSEDTTESTAESEIKKLIHNELLGHYNVQTVTVLGIKDRTSEWGGFKNGYGIKTVFAEFVAVRNTYWNESLNRKLAEECDQAGSVYVLCQPKGHEFSGKIEVDIAYTTAGWKVLSKNYRNLREYVLSGYLLLDEKPKEGYVLPPKPEVP